MGKQPDCIMKINLGGQKGRRKGPFKHWTVVDTREGAEIMIDVMKSPLPLPSDTVEALYTSHTLEHIFPDRLPFVLSECHRVLKPNSVIRIVVPDIDIVIQAYVRKDITFLKDKRNPRKMGDLPEFPICYLSSWFFTYKKEAKGNKRLVGGHVMAFNLELIEHYMSTAGFRSIEQKSYNECSPEFANCDFERYKDCSLYMEAVK